MIDSLLFVLETVLPVFFVVGAGYFCRRVNLLADSVTTGLLTFTTTIAAPVLLFLGMYNLDLGEMFRADLLVSFYAGAIACFFLAMFGARKIFGMRPGESVAVGFAALFSNSLLLGVPVTERAYGTDALGPNFAIIAIHAPLCYMIGITAMEMSRADGRGAAATARAVVTAMFRNALTIGIAIGLAFNLLGLRMPGPLEGGVEMLARAALPVALFGLGGALTRYSLRKGIGPAAMVAGIGLMIHPAITFGLSAGVFGLPEGMVRSATLTASMPPGVNAYVFAAMYARAVGEAASAVLLATAISVLSVSAWLVAVSHAGF
ncbi:AEC family transporter [Rhodovulum sp. DZ06]|uniref:AEC family transporter n=1 Tax=Rhodovulum sp. DZ06 TaxID=3425126 RepID=UPI003D32AF18